MMERKEVKNVIKFLGILCVFALGYLTIVGTSSSDVAEDLGIDTTFDEQLVIPLPEVTVTGPAAPLEFKCDGPTTVYAEAVAAVPDIVDYWDEITSVSVESISTDWDFQVAYSGPEFEPMTCTFYTSRVGSGVTVELAQVTILESGTTSESLAVTSDAWDEILYLFQNPETPFEYCVDCTNDADAEAYTVTSAVTATVTVSGEYL